MNHAYPVTKKYEEALPPKSYWSSWFFFHWKVRTRQLWGMWGCLASSKGTSATPPLSSRATDLQEDHPPWFLDPHAMGEVIFPPNSAWYHKDSELVSNCPLSGHFIFWDNFSLRVYFFPRWSKLGPSTPFWATSVHRDIAVPSSHRTFQDILQEGQHQYTRLTLHMHGMWTELLF